MGAGAPGWPVGWPVPFLGHHCKLVMIFVLYKGSSKLKRKTKTIIIKCRKRKYK